MPIPYFWLTPDWNAPTQVRALCTTRCDLEEASPRSNKKPHTRSGYDSFNVANHVGDDPKQVAHNRQQLAAAMEVDPANIVWLNQVHGNDVAVAKHYDSLPDADACFTTKKGLVCTVMTADCLPVLLSSEDGTQVAAIHAGWRSLASGVISNTLKHFSNPEKVLAWLGPAISQNAFEVGEEVRQAFLLRNADNHTAFRPSIFSDNSENKWMANLYELARIELKGLGITEISGGEHCTYGDSERFYSYRRDGAISGRMASMIWID